MNMSPVKDLKAQTDSLFSQTPKLIADVSNLGQTFQFITRTRIANTTGKRRALIEFIAYPVTFYSITYCKNGLYSFFDLYAFGDKTPIFNGLLNTDIFERIFSGITTLQ